MPIIPAGYSATGAEPKQGETRAVTLASSRRRRVAGGRPNVFRTAAPHPGCARNLPKRRRPHSTLPPKKRSVHRRRWGQHPAFFEWCVHGLELPRGNLPVAGPPELLTNVRAYRLSRCQSRPAINVAAHESFANDDSVYRRCAIGPRGNISGVHRNIRSRAISEAHSHSRADVASYNDVIAVMAAHPNPALLCKAGGSQRQSEEHQYRNLFHIRLLSPRHRASALGNANAILKRQLGRQRTPAVSH